MKRVIWSLVLLCFYSSSGWSQDTLKVGMVDLQKVISESRVGKKAREKFQSEIKKKEADLLKEKQALERLKSDLEKQGMLLREEERQEMERQFQRRYREYTRSMQDSQEELGLREKELTAQIVGELREIVLEIGKKESFTLILERSQALFNGDAHDLTEKVKQLYDQRSAKAGTPGK